MLNGKFAENQKEFDNSMKKISAQYKVLYEKQNDISFNETDCVLLMT